MELRKIASFQVDHRVMDRGMYLSRKDGDIATYDLRMRKPNAGSYLENADLHTIEHLFATYARSSEPPSAWSTSGPWAAARASTSSSATWRAPRR